jgi:hypothetical protein
LYEAPIKLTEVTARIADMYDNKERKLSETISKIAEDYKNKLQEFVEGE